MNLKILAAVLSIAPLGVASVATAHEMSGQSSQSSSSSQYQQQGALNAQPLGNTSLEATSGKVVSATPHTLTLSDSSGQQFTVGIGKKTDFIRDGQIVPGSELREGQQVRAALAAPSAPQAVAVEISPSQTGGQAVGSSSSVTVEQGAPAQAAQQENQGQVQQKCGCKGAGAGAYQGSSSGQKSCPPKASPGSSPSGSSGSSGY